MESPRSCATEPLRVWSLPRTTAGPRWKSCWTYSRNNPICKKRKAMVWEIERKLAEDVARPIVYHYTAATCWHAPLKGYVHQANSICNNCRFDQVWLER
jgi:hypothetical protein